MTHYSDEAITEIAEVIEGLDVLEHTIALPYPARITPPHKVSAVRRTELVTHLADIFDLDGPSRKRFYDACGLPEEEGYLA